MEIPLIAFVLLIVVQFSFGIDGIDLNTKKFDLLMPNVKPHRPELYLCTPVKVDYTRDYYIVAFEPNATSAVAHHMLLYGCGDPGSNKPLWNCGEMSKSDDLDEETGSPCESRSHSQIIYAWARDAPRLNLPDGVGFKIGKNSPIKYLVLQVHYAHIEPFREKGRTDDSGIVIHYTTNALNKLAGVLLLGTSGVIEPMATEHMETLCQIKEDKIIYPFAYRTHTHSLGKVVSGYRIRTDSNDIDNWTLIGKRDPLTPQMFYPVMNNETIRKGDIMAARCTMESHRKTRTFIGATNEDEMCNFYLMYYVDNDEPLEQKYCFSPGPPTFHWNNPEFNLNNIPEDDASKL